MVSDTEKILLFIDDDPSVVPIVETFLNDFHKTDSLRIEKAVSGEEGMKKLESLKPQIIFCDIKMPGISGFEVCKTIRESGWPSAFILMSACDENEKKEFARQAQEAGADGFLTKPIQHNELLFVVSYVLKMERLNLNLLKKNEQLENSLDDLQKSQEQIKNLNLELQDEKRRLKNNLEDMVRLNSQLEAKNEQILSLNDDLVKNFRSTVNMLTDIIEMRQAQHPGHPERVEKISGFIAAKMQLPEHQVESIKTAARLHELGIASQPLLAEDQKSDPEIRKKYAHHTLVGERLLKQFPGFSRVADIVRHLYENVDGTGLPDGLSGNLIPVGSRIVSAASFYDHARLNKPEENPIDILKLLEDEQGRRYDEDVVSFLGEFVQSQHFKDLEVTECSVFALQEGMKLASDLISQSGTQVLKKGVILDKDTLYNILKYNNVDPIAGNVKVQKA